MVEVVDMVPRNSPLATLVHLHRLQLFDIQGVVTVVSLLLKLQETCYL